MYFMPRPDCQTGGKRHNMQNYNLKEIAERIKSLIENTSVENGVTNECISIEKLIEKLNSEFIDYCDYSVKDIHISYGSNTVSKIENGKMLPSTDFLYLIHKCFNKSLDYLIFGKTLPEIEEFQKIYKRLYESNQDLLIRKCYALTEENFKKDRDDEADDELNDELYDEEFLNNKNIVDYRVRLNDVRKYICDSKNITQLEFCKLIHSTKNTMDKYHSTKNEIYSEKYVKCRNSALRYLISFCSGAGVSLDYLLEGTYYDENYPWELSARLWCYDYEQQIKILKLWLEEAKKFKKNQE